MTIREDCQHVLNRVREHFPQLRERLMVVAGGAPRDGYLERPKRYTGPTPTSTFNGDIDVFVGFEDFEAFRQFTTTAAVTLINSSEYSVSPAYLGHINYPIHCIAESTEYWINVQIIAYVYRGLYHSPDDFRRHVLNNFGYLLERFYYHEERQVLAAGSGALQDMERLRITPGHNLIQCMRNRAVRPGVVENQYQRYLKLQNLFTHFTWNPPVSGMNRFSW